MLLLGSEGSFIERKMHVIETEEVENLDCEVLSCPPAHWNIGWCQLARRLADHLIVSLGLLSGHGNDMSLTQAGGHDHRDQGHRKGETRSPRKRL